MSAADPVVSRTLSGEPAPMLSPYRWAWYLPGVLAVGWGGYGVLTAAMGPMPLSWAVFFALGIIGHDVVLAPIAIGVGFLLGRLLPPVLRAPAQIALIGTGVVLLASFAYVQGRGVSSDVPSAVPFNYAARVGVLLAALWVAAAGWAVIRVAASRRPDPTRPSTPVDQPADEPAG